MDREVSVLLASSSVFIKESILPGGEFPDEGGFFIKEFHEGVARALDKETATLSSSSSA